MKHRAHAWHRLLLFIVETLNVDIKGVTVVRDVLYYDGQYHSPQRQILDVYLPPHATDFPVVFFVHGGRWGRHNKSMVGYLARTFAREGLAVVAINHRLTNGSLEQVVHPGHIVDVARAFAWTYHQIAAYGGNPDQIVLMGHSSGAHLVSLLATDRRYLAAHELSPDVIKGVIGLSGVYDFRGPRPLASYIFGDEGQRWEASPIRYVSERQPPVQLLYGGDEPAAVVTDSVLFYNALTEAKSEVELHEIPDRDHFDVPGRAARSGDPARELMLRFIAEHTK